MNIRRLWLLLWVIVVSCRTDLGIELPFEEPRLVVKAMLSPDRPFSARIDHTYPPTGETLFDTLFSGVTVVVFENNWPIDTLRYTRSNLYESGRGLKPRAGSVYRLRLTAPGYPVAESQDERVPPAPNVIQAALDKPASYVISLDLRRSNNQTQQYDVHFTGLFEGRRVQLLVEDLMRPDGIIDNCGFRRDNETFFYRDACAVDGQLTIQFGSSLNGIVSDFFRKPEYLNPRRQSDQLRVQIRTITDSYWNYHRTAPNQEGAEQAFLQPTTRYGNVRGGHGIVTAYNERVVLLNVKP